MRGPQARGNPVDNRGTQKIDGIATPVCALARNDVRFSSPFLIQEVLYGT